MSGIAGSGRTNNHIYDSLDNEEPVINQYSIPGLTNSSNGVNIANSSEAASAEIPIYATVNKPTKRPQGTVVNAATKVPPKTHAKPHTRGPPASVQPGITTGAPLKPASSHVYEVTTLTEDPAQSRDEGSGGRYADVTENPYDDIPGQMSPGVTSADEEPFTRGRLASGGREEAERGRGWPRPPPLRNTDQSSVTEVGVLYQGSMKITDEELNVEGNVGAVRRCIAHYSHPVTALHMSALQEWTADMSMQLVIDDESLKLRQSMSKVCVVHDDLIKIRVWGTGKEPDSAIFAYITRDDRSDGSVCRVLKCTETTGQQVSALVNSACQRKLKDLKTSAPEPDLSKKGKSDNSIERSLSNETKVSIKCLYVGKFTFTENSGKEELKKLILMKCSTPLDSWVKVSMDLSSSHIVVRDSKTSGSIHMSCSVKDVVGAGVNKEDNKFACITVRNITSMTEYIGHVFHCEPSADHCLVNILTICKPQLHESKNGIMKKMNKYFTGAKKN